MNIWSSIYKSIIPIKGGLRKAANKKSSLLVDSPLRPLPPPPRLSGQNNGYKKILSSFFLSGQPLTPSPSPLVDCPLKKRPFLRLP